MAKEASRVYSLVDIGASPGGVDALWTAFRTLEESAALARRLAHRAEDSNSPLSANQFIVRAADYETRAQTVRAVLDRLSGLTEPGGADE